MEVQEEAVVKKHHFVMDHSGGQRWRAVPWNFCSKHIFVQE